MPHPAAEPLCLNQQGERGRERGGEVRREGKREGRKKREKGREWVGGGGRAQITSHHCYSPAQGQQQRGGMLSYVLYSVGLPSFLSPRREKDGECNECNPFTAHPHKHTHKHRHAEKKVRTVPQLQKTKLLKNKQTKNKQ